MTRRPPKLFEGFRRPTSHDWLKDNHAMKKLFSVRAIILTGSLLLQLGTLSFHSRGAAGDVDLSFDPGSGVNSAVNSVAVQPDGKVLIGGDFTTVKGLARAGIARLNADGSGDASFDPAGGLSNIYVAAIALQPDGKILVCGKTRGYRANAFAARLNSDGTSDSTFVPAPVPHPSYALGEGDGYNSVIAQPDGKVVLGGYYGDYFKDDDGGDNYPPRALTVRLNANGTTDPSFASASGEYYTGIHTVARQADGKLLIINSGDQMSRLNANGTLDSAFGALYGVASVAIQPDGKLLVGGSFITVNGTTRNRIARINASGSLDTTFNPGTGVTNDPSSYPYVNYVAAQPDGKVLIAGRFTIFNGTNRNGIARLNANGSLDTIFNPGTALATNNPYSQLYILSSATQPDGKVLIVGSFMMSFNGTNRGRVARLNANGSLDGSFHPGAGMDNSITALASQPDGKVLVAGRFSTVNGTNRNGIARLNADGGLDTSFNPVAGVPWYGFPGDIRYVISQLDGKVLIAGSFATVNGTNRNGIARLNADGGLDTSFNPATEANDSVTAAVLQPDGKIILGGYFASSNPVNGWYSQQLVRLNSNGSRDNNFTADSQVAHSFTAGSLVVQSDAKVLVGGIASTFVSDPDNGDYWASSYLLTRLNPDGSRDTSFEAASGEAEPLSTGVKVVALQPDGKVIFGGEFSTVKGASRNRIARLNANGTLDTTFNPGVGITGSASFENPALRSIALRPDGKIVIAGFFTAVDGTSVNHIARLNSNGSLDNSFNPGAGGDGIVRSIALQSDGNVLIGGDFLTVKGVLRPYVARLYGDSVAPFLNIARSNAFVIVSWPVTGLNFQLQGNTNLSLPNSWSSVAEPAITNTGQISVTVPTTVGRKFFRLRSQ
jgi:uncharacterized delta-60 repeat protein